MKTTKKLTSLSRIATIFLLAVVAVSCKPEKKEEIGNYEKGIFILNEGLFQHGTSEVTYYNPSTKQAQQDIFSAVNSRALGDVGQSIEFYDNKYYIVVNNSDKIEVVDMNFKSVAVFEGVAKPRFLKFNAGKCYVTSWGNEGVLVLSPSNGAVLERISVGRGAEGMQLIGTKLYVANSGGYEVDSTVSVVNIANSQVETINVGYNPGSFAVDNNDNLWVLLQGKYNADWSVSGAGLAKINPSTNEVMSKIDFESGMASSLCSNGDNLYYLFNGGINKASINDTQAPAEHFVSGYFYKLFYKSGKLYATDAGDWSSDGKVCVFDANTGTALDTIPAGIGPTYVLFRD
ncbi:MAG: YncE family protein [Salinivirgaceae bacterium]|jgi:hypothetical protein|nr:hypothetical protein [Bacteroidales bacterium]